MHIRKILTGAAVVMPGVAALVAVTATSASAAATAPPGYRIVRTANLAAPPSIFNTTGQASCPTGTVPWGGGVSMSNGFAAVGTSINTSEPVAGSWRARVNNASGTAQSFRVDVICAKQPKGYKVAFASADNPPHDNTPATASCPTGTVVLSGGALSTSDTTAEAITSLGPNGSHGYSAFIANTSNVDQHLTVFAVCAAKPPKYAIVSQSVSDMGPDDPVETPVCPAGTSVLGGGFKVAAPGFDIPIAGSLDEDRHGWFGEAVNQRSGATVVTGQAICGA
ncbi:MAG TPA: hypothetical protein VGL44_10840 [Gaiellales bacterium]|jgi:hypothetical protein